MKRPRLSRARKYVRIHAALLRATRVSGPGLYYLCNDYLDAPACILLRGFRGSKVISEFHSVWCWEAEIKGRVDRTNGVNIPPWAFHRLESELASRSDAVVVLNQTALRHLKPFNDRIFLVPPLVDTDYHSRDERSRIAIRRKYRIEDKTVIGVLGPFTSSRNASVLQSLALAEPELSPRGVVLAVGVKSNTMPEFPGVMYTGYVEDLRAYLSAVDLVIVDPAYATTGPLNKVLVPMSYSLPVLTTRVGISGLDYVTPGKDLIVTEHSQLLQALNHLWDDPSRLAALGTTARTTVLEYYSRTANSPKLEEVLTSLEQGEAPLYPI